MNVSLEEAAWRLEMQQALSESGLPAALMEEEAETFAGLWWEHEPAFRVVVAFTRGGEETIRPYLENQPFADLVDVRDDYAYSYHTLRAKQQEAAALLEQLAVGAASYVDVADNRVYLEVGNPDLFREELTTAGLALPEAVAVRSQNPDKRSDTLRGSVEMVESPAGQTIFFPKQAPTNIYLEAEVRGMLRLDENGCLRLTGPDEEETHLILWRADHALRFEEEEIAVVDGGGAVIARVGEPLHGGGGYLGGGHTPTIPGMPIEACPGPYLILGALPPLETETTPGIFVYPFPLADTGRMGQFYAQSTPAPAGGVISGPLTIESSCLRVDGYTVLWPPDLYPEEDADPMQIVYRTPNVDAYVVATVGERVALAGSERTAEDYRYFANKVNCAGPYWGVYEVE
jgi:hypothetical protein